MSFTTEIKKELSKKNNLSNKNLVKAELFGYLGTNNISEDNGKLKFATESEYNINRFSKLLSNLKVIGYNINIIGNNFNILIPKKEVETIRQIYQNYEVAEVESEQKAFVRGCFLGSGSINNPQNKYHIEIILRDLNTANDVVRILNSYNINFKVLVQNKNNKKKISIYSKDGEEISKFLAFTEATSSVLKFEEIRVYRDMRNNVNRMVNCETANLAKTVDAAIKQINAIKKLQETGKFNELPDNLKELAKLRLENPEVSLVELGQMLKEPIGKSGVNYRLKTIIKFSQQENDDVQDNDDA